MAESKSIDPEPQDFAAAEASVGPLLEENGSPACASILHEAAQAHKLIRGLKDTAQRIHETGNAVRPRSTARTRSRNNITKESAARSLNRGCGGRQLAPLSTTSPCLIRKTFVAHPHGFRAVVLQGMPSGSGISILSYGLLYLPALFWRRVGRVLSEGVICHQQNGRSYCEEPCHSLQPLLDFLGRVIVWQVQCYFFSASSINCRIV